MRELSPRGSLQALALHAACPASVPWSLHLQLVLVLEQQRELCRCCHLVTRRHCDPDRLHAGGVHKAEGDLWLSPETRLLVDAPGCDSFEYDGAGHRLVRPPAQQNRKWLSCRGKGLHSLPV